MAITAITDKGDVLTPALIDHINANFAQYTSPTGNALIDGTLEVTGATTLDTTLAVTGNTALTGTLVTTGAVTNSSTTHAVGAVTADGAVTVAGTLTASAALHAVGAFTADGAVTITGLTKTGPVKRTLTAITANGAIDSHTSANYIFTKAGVAVMTLAAPTATADDGIIITLTGTTADQNTVTATNLFATGAAANDVATWPAAAGGTLSLMAYQGLWYVIFNNLVVMS